MELWEAILFIVASIVGGCVFFISLVRITSLFEQKPQTTSSVSITSPFTSEKTEAPSVIKEQPKLTTPRLMAEVDDNLRISSEPWTGELIPFDTRVWDAQQYEVYQLPINLRNNLKQVYADIGLANQIVWFSTEFNRKSQEVDESYRRMRTSIAEELRRIKQRSQNLDEVYRIMRTGVAERLYRIKQNVE